MTTLLFDTLRLSRTLRDKGHFTPEQAETLAQAFGEATHEDLATKADFSVLEAAFKAEIGIVKAEIANVATKAGLAELRAELKTDIAELRAELKTDIAELRAEFNTDIAELRAEFKTDIAELRAEIGGVKAEIGGVRAEIGGVKAELKADIAEVKADILKWMVGAIGFQTAATLGTIVGLVKIFAK